LFCAKPVKETKVKARMESVLIALFMV